MTDVSPPPSKHGLTVDHQNSRKKLVKVLERRRRETAHSDGKTERFSVWKREARRQNSIWSRKESERRTFTPPFFSDVC